MWVWFELWDLPPGTWQSLMLNKQGARWRCGHADTHTHIRKCTRAHTLCLTPMHTWTVSYSPLYTHTHWSASTASFKLDETQHLWDGERFCLADEVGLVCVCMCACVPVCVRAHSHKVENQFLCCHLHLAQPAVISLAASLPAVVLANKINLRPKGNWSFQWEDKSIWGKAGRAR